MNELHGRLWLHRIAPYPRANDMQQTVHDVPGEQHGRHFIRLRTVALQVPAPIALQWRWKQPSHAPGKRRSEVAVSIAQDSEWRTPFTGPITISMRSRRQCRRIDPPIEVSNILHIADQCRHRKPRDQPSAQRRPPPRADQEFNAAPSPPRGRMPITGGIGKGFLSTAPHGQISPPVRAAGR